MKRHSRNTIITIIIINSRGSICSSDGITSSGDDSTIVVVAELVAIAETVAVVEWWRQL